MGNLQVPTKDRICQCESVFHDLAPCGISNTRRRKKKVRNQSRYSQVRSFSFQKRRKEECYPSVTTSATSKATVPHV